MPSVPSIGAPPEPPIFHDVLRPSGVMSAACFTLLAAVILSAGLAFGALLLARGFAIASLFLAAEVILLLTMLHVCRLRRCWSEVVRADSAGITVNRYDHAGRHREGTILPLMNLTLERLEDPEYGLRRLRMISRGRAVELARDLAPNERAGFANRFEDALRRACCPPRAQRLSLPALAGPEGRP